MLIKTVKELKTCKLCKELKVLTSHHILNINNATNIARLLSKNYKISCEIKSLTKHLHIWAGTEKMCRECHDKIDEIKPNHLHRQKKKIKIKILTQAKKAKIASKYTKKFSKFLNTQNFFTEYENPEKMLRRLKWERKKNSTTFN